MPKLSKALNTAVKSVGFESLARNLTVSLQIYFLSARLLLKATWYWAETLTATVGHAQSIPKLASCICNQLYHQRV
jgi:hypothetical protein